MSKGWSICQKGGPFVKRCGPFVKRCGPFVKGVPEPLFTYTTATLLVKEWMIILTVFLHVLHGKISSVMPLESPTPELHFC